MNSEKMNDSNRILAITIGQIPALTENCMRKSFSEKMLCFVARLIHNGDTLILTDETGFFYYELKNTQRDIQLAVGEYYECLGMFKNFNMTFRMEIISIKNVDCNYITLHMVRVMKQSFKEKTNQEQQKALQRTNNKESMEKSAQKSEKVYEAMKNWCENRKEFTKEDLQREFGLFTKIEADALDKIEDEQLIGNMGEYYKWI